MSRNAYDTVKLARSNKRPTSLDFIHGCFTDFFELHGDRRYGDDAAVVGGLAELNGRSVTVISIEKGRSLRERMQRSFGAPQPEGYRKALRLMKQAEKFRRPVICLVDTSGAYCGIGAEERGQGQAIAENLMEMMTLRTPVISLLIGLAVGFASAMIPALHMDKILIGDIMLLIPGLAMTNAIRNILVGNTISGVVRLAESLIWAAALAGGFMVALLIVGALF